MKKTAASDASKPGKPSWFGGIVGTTDKFHQAVEAFKAKQAAKLEKAEKQGKGQGVGDPVHQWDTVPGATANKQTRQRRYDRKQKQRGWD